MPVSGHIFTKISNSNGSSIDGLNKNNKFSEESAHLNEQKAVYETQSSKQNRLKFHDSMKFEIKQCFICKEAWPYKQGTKENNFISYRCKRDKDSPKKFSVENNMIPPKLPEELHGLTQFEKMLIA